MYMVLHVDEATSRRVWRHLYHVVFMVHIAIFNGSNLFTDRYHGMDKPVQFL